MTDCYILIDYLLFITTWANVTYFYLNFRNYVKANVLGSLGSEGYRPSAAAQCVQYIAVVELPQNMWPNLIQVIHSLFHSYLFFHLLAHLVVCSFIRFFHSVVFSLMCPFIDLFIHWFVLSFSCPFIDLFIHWFVLSLMCPFIDVLFFHWLVLSLISSFID